MKRMSGDEVDGVGRRLSLYFGGVDDERAGYC